ncbi:MAG: PhnD/SsuA/transferrin family substrate-binding protein [Acidimicrobiia bacterium]|nr:PhnD/SsuA/transferrin family substrate-binding protein [Acidimicrobiia bacterium]
MALRINGLAPDNQGATMYWKRNRRAHRPRALIDRRVVMLALIALVAVACGGGEGGDTDTTGATEATSATETEPEATSASLDEAGAEIQVGVMPFADSVYPHIAEAEGYFAEEGLTVEMTTFQAGDQLVTANISGDIHIGFAGVVPQLNALSQGAPLTFLAGSGTSNPEPPDGHAILVKADSDIQGPEDLAGKRVAGNIIGSVVWLTGLEWLDQNGVDTESVEFAEVPFPQMGDALLQGDLDAILQLEPFTSVLESSGDARVLAYPYYEVNPEMLVFAAAGNTPWVEENPEAVEGFIRAIQKAMDLRESDNELFLDYIAEYTGMERDLASSITLTQSEIEIDAESLQRTVDLLLKWEVIDEGFDVAPFVRPIADS